MTTCNQESEYDKIADAYQGLFQDEDSKKENEEVISKIDIKGSVLDIGCGSGLLLDYAKISPADYIGIDPSKRMLEYFKTLHPGYKTLNCKFEDFRNGCFDTIISLFGSPSYIKPGQLHRIKKMLSPGGTAFLMFYLNDYVPVTYIKTGIFLSHYKNYSEGEIYHNYNIVIWKK